MGRIRRKIKSTYTENIRRIESDEVPCEFGLVRVDELPRSTLGERLRCKVDKYGPCSGAFTLHGRDGRVVPVRLVVRAWVWVGLADRDYG